MMHSDKIIIHMAVVLTMIGKKARPQQIVMQRRNNQPPLKAGCSCGFLYQERVEVLITPDAKPGKNYPPPEQPDWKETRPEQHIMQRCSKHPILQKLGGRNNHPSATLIGGGRARAEI